MHMSFSILDCDVPRCRERIVGTSFREVIDAAKAKGWRIKNSGFIPHACEKHTTLEIDKAEGKMRGGVY